MVARSGENWDRGEALRAVLLGVIVQAAANVNNTYWDFVNGVDTPTVSEPLIQRCEWCWRAPCLSLAPVSLAPCSSVHVSAFWSSPYGLASVRVSTLPGVPFSYATVRWSVFLLWCVQVGGGADPSVVMPHKAVPLHSPPLARTHTRTHTTTASALAWLVEQMATQKKHKRPGSRSQSLAPVCPHARALSPCAELAIVIHALSAVFARALLRTAGSGSGCYQQNNRRCSLTIECVLSRFWWGVLPNRVLS